MVKFQFPLRDPAGLSPEAAGRLVKEAIGCTGRVQIRKGEKSGDAKLIFHVLSCLPGPATCWRSRWRENMRRKKRRDWKHI